jgi:hypothetical protein
MSNKVARTIARCAVGGILGAAAGLGVVAIESPGAGATTTTTSFYGASADGCNNAPINTTCNPELLVYATSNPEPYLTGQIEASGWAYVSLYGAYWAADSVQADGIWILVGAVHYFGTDSCPDTGCVYRLSGMS